MSRRKNRNSRDTDTTENENIESVESEVEADATEEVTEDTSGIEETIDEVAAEVDGTEVDVDHEYEEIEQVEVDKTEMEQDQGFDQQSEPVAATNSGGKGMAGTAMAVSLLALAGTGYNWYDTKSLKSTQAAGSEQAAVDYSGQIANLEQQIQSLTESQEKLNVMSAAAQADTEESASVAESDSTESTAEVESSTEQAEAVAQETETSTQQTASSDQVEEAEATEESSESMAAETDEQAVEQDSEQAVTEDTIQTEVAASETASEPEAETAVEEAVTEASTSDSGAMTAASMPSSDEIKQIAIQQVDEVLADAKKRLGLNEVAQLLSIGEQRLSLAGDVAGAQAAFSIADERLAAFSDPVIDPVRESIAGNIESLAAVELVDKNVLTQDLSNLASTVDTLAFKPLETLADDEQPAEEPATEEAATQTTETSTEGESAETLSLEGAGNLIKTWGSKLGDTIGEVGSGIAGDLKNMVRIKKTGPMSDVVLAPEQEYFIRENMKLMLGGAQRAVLQSNAGVYQQNIGQAQSLLGEFFDSDNSDVQSVASRLTDLAQINLEPELPDISNSSASLSAVLKQLASADSSN